MYTLSMWLQIHYSPFYHTARAVYPANFCKYDLCDFIFVHILLSVDTRRLGRLALSINKVYCSSSTHSTHTHTRTRTSKSNYFKVNRYWLVLLNLHIENPNTNTHSKICYLCNKHFGIKCRQCEWIPFILSVCESHFSALFSHISLHFCSSSFFLLFGFFLCICCTNVLHTCIFEHIQNNQQHWLHSNYKNGCAHQLLTSHSYTYVA